MKIINIAIDGPSGAGKSTLAKMLAADFGFIYVDTGAIYRSVGLYVLRKGIGSKDAAAVSAALPEIDVEMRYNDGAQLMILNGEDVTSLLRTPEVSIYASDVSAMPDVRRFLLEKQRKLAKENSVIMDGRDIGTVVLPDAEIKIFLTASPETRAKRRFIELTEKGIETTYEDVLADQFYRDKNDSSRALAPLKPAADAVYVDTTYCDLEESKRILRKIVEEKLEK
ncbi:MAG: (d)CMP kinase [Oscillospiraceae bacterium]|nr:(d)CMP kinase [Oscillospiraceae bacterium]